MDELEQFEQDGKNLNRQQGNSRPTFGEDAEFYVETVKCEICDSFIGKCDMSKFSVPIDGSMFIPKDHKHGYPAPFYGHATEWMELRCPICNRRPFLNQNYFLNIDDEKCGNVYECPDCDSAFPTILGLNGHKGQVHKES